MGRVPVTVPWVVPGVVTRAFFGMVNKWESVANFSADAVFMVWNLPDFYAGTVAN
ncbi:hypothetical protein HPY86_03390 [candidate division WOR-3 bacterium]|nr:hypothetical protein [candidate division WOR-3 bacterium]